MDNEFLDYEAKYTGINVDIITKDNKSYSGIVSAVIPAEDIDDNRNMIVLNATDKLTELFIDEIKQIKTK
ncbi:hypothetical protein [Companilactobacillus sp. DQM5]|uniref:hypothetical protein n=1 Tax=Companilactobacillus sp. DQM5 TaxID=3463359 RepID=UPI0040597DA5